MSSFKTFRKKISSLVNKTEQSLLIYYKDEDNSNILMIQEEDFETLISTISPEDNKYVIYLEDRFEIIKKKQINFN